MDSIVNLLLKKDSKGQVQAQFNSSVLSILYVSITIGLTIFSVWFQEKFTPRDSEERLKKTENVSGSLNMLKQTFTMRQSAKPTTPQTPDLIPESNTPDLTPESKTPALTIKE